ncbi:hypothetical protein KDAU_09850 [Dictyobacter aurantiacus]|uniref:Uncharacterized protein n=1 Tax=Dictyobacter aurantiacus TaxID=1936993 RepID=A0A401ZA23_9CHLR|nr:hypothetical protein KDAU_09850 [Dictyobacter aurantiacus]
MYRSPYDLITVLTIILVSFICETISNFIRRRRHEITNRKITRRSKGKSKTQTLLDKIAKNFILH